MIDKAAIADPKTRYGSGKLATRWFRVQRLTGMLNVGFTVFFVWFVVRLARAERAEMVDVIRNPIVALILCALIFTVCSHMRIGMNEVIEDYIDDEKTNHLAQRANLVFSLAVPALTILAVAKIVFWG